MITMHGVTKRFRRVVAVDNVSLTIDAGDSVAIWGPNGAGKTTLIHCLLGLHRHKGAITVNGYNTRSRGKIARASIGYVPQEIGFYDDLVVGEGIRHFARLRGVRRVEIGGTLDRVGLAGQHAKRVRDLSGGMKQRLALAIALLGDPPILVLDEVTASLDACGREEFMSFLGQLSGAGRTMLFASHRIDEIAALAKRVVVMEAGRLTKVMDVASFASSHGVGSFVHLAIPERTRPRAMSVLVEGGFEPRLNGVGIIVPVRTDQKAAPIALLARASITVDDFEIISRASADAHAPGQLQS